ncbi:ROK family transcriptional regulator (plasmid) [Agrobacterium fabrum]|uniref:ROK family transcriptional regulator n=1 Tax=Agrobacterium fabrum TaxID=1176649 RepID=UPI000DD0B62A|nr:ROK family transcriptional regulator [Agrobacterium fabrum]MDH6298687.1 putative NBD/HSP70 family sugar kinase [Agrobacterium fabrum]UXT61440.1 ROK family transcriptional regulator [Agrobacterium fabrum]
MTFHKELNELQRQTLESLIISEHAPSRFELSNLFGVSPQTMTRAVKGLVEHGIVDEQPEATGNRGQPSRRLIFRQESLLVVGLVLANHEVVLTVEDLVGKRLFKLEQLGDFREPGPTLEAAAGMVEKAFESFGGGSRIVGIGIAAQGFFVERGRKIVSIGNPVAWAAVDLKAYFEDRFALPVTIHNDAKAVAVGTIREGVARRHSHYFCIYIAGGIGGALVHDGRLYEGISANAGEVGYFVPRDEVRPTVPNFLATANLRNLSEWVETDNIEGPILDWCRNAGAALSPIAQMCVRIYDVDTIFVCSPLPKVVLEAICQAVQVEPIGRNILEEADAKRLLKWPTVVATNDASLNRGACALAVYQFLRAVAPGSMT